MSRMSTAARKNRQREFLFREQGGLCYWCGCVMVMPVHVDRQPHPRNVATINHLFSRLSEDRGKVSGRTHVPACWQCNEDRGRAEEQALPIDELRRRVEAGHKKKRA